MRSCMCRTTVPWGCMRFSCCSSGSIGSGFKENSCIICYPKFMIIVTTSFLTIFTSLLTSSHLRIKFLNMLIHMLFAVCLLTFVVVLIWVPRFLVYTYMYITSSVFPSTYYDISLIRTSHFHVSQRKRSTIGSIYEHSYLSIYIMIVIFLLLLPDFLRQLLCQEYASY